MIISHNFKYVYVGIPRTSSKSMNHWLMDHFDGQWFGTHHQMEVPEEARDYLIFTVVRNPYDLWISNAFHVPWDDQGPKEEDLRPYRDEQERRRKSLILLETWEKQQRDSPQRSVLPLEERIAEAKRDSDGGCLQKHKVEKAGVRLVLYFERLPSCLAELPFVDSANIPPFPHHPERGIRPPGDFYDFFPSEEEQVVWAAAEQDFQIFHYHRFDRGLPEDAPNALWIT